MVEVRGLAPAPPLMRYAFLLLVGLALTVAAAAQVGLSGTGPSTGPDGAAKGAPPMLPDGFFLADVAGGARFDFPVATVASPAGDLYVVEKAGVIRVVRSGAVLPEPFIDLREEVLNADDRGLLGFAFDPDFETNRFVYLAL